MTAPLDWKAVAATLRAQGASLIGRRVVYLAEVGSTNDVARDLAEQGEPEGAVVVADRQTAGRGRSGKSAWLTPPGTSIAVSVLLRPRLSPAGLPVLAALCGIAACDAIAEVVGLTAALKWPNDVLVRERKAGGILIESRLGSAGVAFVVAGLGINVNLPAAALGPLPDAAIPATTLLEEAGHPTSREALLVALLSQLDRGYQNVVKGALDPVWHAYRARLATLGQPVRVLAGDETVDGIAEDLGPAGELVVRLADGRRRAFGYGEVTVRGARHSAPRSGA